MFDVDCMKAISQTIKIINAADNGIKNALPLSFIDNIEYLYLKNNSIENLDVFLVVTLLFMFVSI